MSLLPATFADVRSGCATENLQPVRCFTTWQASQNEASTSRRIFLTHSIATGGIVNLLTSVPTSHGQADGGTGAVGLRWWAVALWASAAGVGRIAHGVAPAW